jgi:hypothetical protein
VSNVEQAKYDAVETHGSIEIRDMVASLRIRDTQDKPVISNVAIVERVMRPNLPVELPVTPNKHRHHIPNRCKVVAHLDLAGLHHEYILAPKIA